MFRGFTEEAVTEENYRGFHLHQVDRRHLFWAIETLDGSELPKRLEGTWTHLDLAKRAVDALLPTDEKEEA